MLAKESEAMLRRDHGGPEQLVEWASEAERLLGTIDERTERLASVRDDALQLTVDELAFLTSEDESQIVSLLGLFASRDRLEERVNEIRQRYGQ
jgi:hypothetical protein